MKLFDQREPAAAFLAMIILIGLACAGCARESKLAMATAARTESASWQHMLEALDSASATVDAFAESPLEKREGYRMLARTTALGFDRFLEFASGDVPEFFRLQSAHRKFAGDNPDQLYHAATLDPRLKYRIRGQWADAHTKTVLIEIGVYGGGLSFDDPDAKRRLVAYLDESTLQVADDGRFEVMLSIDEPPDGTMNWMQLAEDAEQLLVRRYFSGPQPTDPFPLSIELIDAAPSTSPLAQRALAKGLIGTGAFVRETVKVWGNWYSDVRDAQPVNTLSKMRDDGDLLTPTGVQYLQGAWALPPGEALLIKFDVPDVPYWGFLPMNIWLESLDWRVARVALNNFTAQQAPDGSVTIVLADAILEDIPNSIATLGHLRGLMSMRLARLGTQRIPVIQTLIVPLASVTAATVAGAFDTPGAPDASRSD